MADIRDYFSGSGNKTTVSMAYMLLLANVLGLAVFFDNKKSMKSSAKEAKKTNQQINKTVEPASLIGDEANISEVAHEIKLNIHEIEPNIEKRNIEEQNTEEPNIKEEQYTEEQDIEEQNVQESAGEQDTEVQNIEEANIKGENTEDEKFEENCMVFDQAEEIDEQNNKEIPKLRDNIIDFKEAAASRAQETKQQLKPLVWHFPKK